jgi:hypothetical protein
MTNYTVSLRDTNTKKVIRANNELDAKVKFCQKENFDYRVFANKLEVEKTKGDKKQ